MTDITKQMISAAIYGQESGGGSADTSQVNSSNVTGPMQVQQGTFDALKNKGIIPNKSDWKNPEDNKAAGDALVGYLFDKYQGDPSKVAAAYYGGEKAVRADGTIANFKDRKNPGNPDVNTYVSNILSRLGAVPTVTGQPPGNTLEPGQGPDDAPVAIQRTSAQDFGQQMPGRQAKPVKGPAPVTNFGAPNPGTPAPAPADTLAQVTNQEQNAESARDSISFLDKAKDAFIENTFAGAVIRKLSANQWLDGQTPQPGYQPDPKALTDALGGATQDEWDYYKEAVNPAHADKIISDISDHRAAEARINASGTGVGIMASLVAGAPEGILSGMGVAKAFSLAKLSSAALAANGAGRGAALAAGFGENLAANVGLVGMQSAIDPYVSKDDYAMAFGMSALGSLVGLHGTIKAADEGSAMAQFRRTMDAAAESQVATRNQAIRNLGEGASPEALIAETKRLEAQSVRDQITSMGTVDEKSRLLPDDEETNSLRQDVPEEKAGVPPEEPMAPGHELPPTEEGNVARETGANADGTPLPTTKETPKVQDTQEVDKVWNKWSTMTDFDGEQTYRAYKDTDLGKKLVSEQMEGSSNVGWAEKQAPGTHVLTKFEEHAAGNGNYKDLPALIETIRSKFMDPGTKITLGLGDSKFGSRGEAAVLSVGKGVHLMHIKPGLSRASAATAIMHEMAHAIVHDKLRAASPELLSRLVSDHRLLLNDLAEGNHGSVRINRLNETDPAAYYDGEGQVNGDPTEGASYIRNPDEWLAERGTSFMTQQIRNGNKLGASNGIVLAIKSAWEKVKGLFEFAKEKGVTLRDDSANEFFQRAMDGTLADVQKERDPGFLDAGLMLPSESRNPQVAAAIYNDPKAQEHGLQNIPVNTLGEQAEAKAVLGLYKKADADGGYHADEKRLSKLLDTAPFKNAQSTANTMARSKNPVVRMVAALLLENPSGAQGRRSTAAISKFMNEQKFLGNSLGDFQSAYKDHRVASGVPVTEDFFGGKTWASFNRMVSEEIESRRPGAPSIQSSPAVKQGADAIQAAYQRLADGQRAAKTVGWASLADTSEGYMPHRMSAEKFRQLSPEQENVIHEVLVDQFQAISGFDPTFSQNLASKYLDRVRRSGLGGFEAPMGIHQVGAADVVEDALTQMGLDRQQVTSMMKKYMAGGAGHTKARLSLDLNAVHQLSDGSSFKLMDVFETDQFRLLRSQTRRVAGEVALANQGIMGMAGLKLLRRAMEFGGAGEKATAQEIKAFDQVSAEFLGGQFGTQSKFVDRALQVTSLSRLGGMGFTQAAEAINGIFHVGVLRSLDGLFGIGRLRSEAIALSRGEHVDNPILGSFEHFTGAEFGVEPYKTVFPFDNQSLEYQTYGKETITSMDRLLRGGQYVNGKLSFWRTIHATQQRGFAEQIVRKAAQYLKDGTNDVALRDMGFTDELMAKMRKDLPNIAQFNGNRLTNFDITKTSDLKAAEQFTQSIHRGVSQIIQGSFIGERNAWAHDGVMRMLTQFRTFGLTSIEKQWGRQVGNVGTAKALAMVLGSMSLAAPVFIARTQLAAIGRDDREKYLEQQLTPLNIAHATMNYVAGTGIAGDFLDAVQAVSGAGSSGGRAGGGQDFIGGALAPAAGVANDVYKGLQNTKDGTDPHDLLKALPFSRLPWMIPALNALGK